MGYAGRPHSPCNVTRETLHSGRRTPLSLFQQVDVAPWPSPPLSLPAVSPLRAGPRPTSERISGGLLVAGGPRNVYLYTFAG